MVELCIVLTYSVSIGVMIAIRSMVLVPGRVRYFVVGIVVGIRMKRLCEIYCAVCLCSPPDPHQDACSWILSEYNRCSFALVSALPSSSIHQIRIHWLLNAVTVHSRSVTKEWCSVKMFCEYVSALSLARLLRFNTF